ncbi:protocadherin Fat 4-like [Lingula anatina]|uniref:Protocadherin Fat 4-like n=1 Tax=Lingula anatina TaxID=7574 RepID=A0A2R2MSF1_LINAN|nr:protocadherin Fat 4-like [Lingula anatina]|eukprot:XP_023933063.1 protocadherin Fat 4-like [Lingula anatina]
MDIGLFESPSVAMLRVRAVDLGVPARTSQTINVTLNVQRNYHPPYFLNLPHNITNLAVDTRVNTLIYTVQSRDNDTHTPFNDISYFLIGDDSALSYFNLDQSSGIISLRRDLTSDSNQFYRLRVIAVDGGLPPKQFTATGTIDISLKMNIHAPIIQPTTYTANITEDHDVDESIGIVITATDQDIRRPENEVQYEILGGHEYFGINASTGVIYVKKWLRKDSTETGVYTFLVTAYDKGYPRKQSQIPARVIVYVIRERQCPQFNITDYSGSVDVTAQPGTFVLQVQAEDVGGTGGIDYTIIGDDAAPNVFQIDQTTGRVSTKEGLASDNSVKYQLRIQASNRAVVPCTTNIVINIGVLRNFHRPVFQELTYQTTILETHPVNSPIPGIRLNATDKDEVRPDSVVVYSLVDSPDARFFELDEELGVLSLKQSIWGFTKTRYVFTATAKDKGNPPQTSRFTAQITVNVLRNSHPPVIDTNRDYVITIPDTTPVNTQVIRVEATDNDTRPEFSTIGWEVVGSANSALYFTIDQNGWVRVKKNLQETPQINFLVLVRAYDSGLPAKEAMADVHIIVDHNRDRPIWRQSSFSHRILETQETHETLLTVLAEDSSALPPFNEVEYKVIGRDQQAIDYFGMEGRSLYLRKSLNGINPRIDNFVIEILAYDKGTPSKNASTVATVNMGVDYNLYPPEFLGEPYSVNVSTDSSGAVFQIRTRDNDTVIPFNRTTYEMTGIYNTPDYFGINPLTGMISLKPGVMLSRIDEKKFVAVIVVRDGGKHQSQKTAETTVEINVVCGGQGPYFPSSIARLITLSEDRGNGLVHTVTAQHFTQSTDNTLVYRKSGSGSATQYFIVNSGNGEITLIRSLKLSNDPFMQLTIEAEDQCGRIATIQLHIQIDRGTTGDGISFIGAPYIINITEAQAINETLFTANAGVGVTYSIQSYGNILSYFNIDQLTGQVRLTQSIRNDIYKLPFYVLSIQGRRGSATGVATAIVNVLRNAYCPEFSRRNGYTFQVPENYPLAVGFGQVSAIDKDGDIVSYSILGNAANEFFFIDNGTLLLRKSLEDANIRTFAFTVRASDNQVPPCTRQTSVTVQVTTNNTLPVFLNLPAIVNTTSNISPGRHLFTVLARDSNQQGTLQYSIVGPPGDASYFNMEPNGRLTLRSSLGGQSGRTFTIRVVVFDSAFPDQRTQDTITINVICSPRGPNLLIQRYYLTITDQFSAGQEVGVPLVASHPTNDSLTFKIIGDNQVNQWYYIESRTGQIYTRRPMKDAPQSSDEFAVEVSDQCQPPKTAIAHVNVTILRSGAQPAFENLPFTLPLPVNTTINRAIYQVKATDENLVNTINYRVMGQYPATQYFEMRDPTSGLIYIKRSMTEDETRTSAYFICVAAYDSAFPNDQAIRCLTVTPLRNFARPEVPDYIRNISNTFPVGSVVLDVNATDADGDELVYDLPNNSELRRAFFIDKTTGEIRLLTSLANQNGQFRFSVIVYERDNPSRVGIGTVTIHYGGSGGTSSCEISFPQGQLTARIKENIQVGEVFVRTQLPRRSCVKQGDSTEDELVYDLPNNSELRRAFFIDKTTGEIRLLTSLANQNGQFRFSVIVYERDNPSRVGIGTVTIHYGGSGGTSSCEISFPQGQLTARIKENIQVGEVFVRTQLPRRSCVKQGDSTEGEFEFLLEATEPAASYFGVNRTTGDIFVTKYLRDLHDSYTKFQLTLVVRDSADHEVTDSMVVNVDVTRNIHQPSLRVFYQQEIPETQGVGTQVANLTGSDLDGDELRYEITGTNQTRQYFYVIPTEGGIYLKKPLQGPEHPRLFYFNVKVRDQRNPEKSSTASFTIRVSSENVPPQWLQLPYGTNIKRNASVGDVVITVAAADPDLKGTLRYRLGPGVVPAPYFFTIDEITGQVKVRNSLTLGTDSVYNLRVQAFDDGYPFNYNETTVTLTIPQQAPVWQTTVITRNISRSLGPGSTVITLDGYVTDPDGDHLTYTPEDGSTPGAYSYFLLRQDNGKIIVTGLLSQAPSSTYRFNIRATDNRRPQQSASGVVIINLMDEEKPPVQNISYTTTIDDTHLVNSDVFELRNSGNVVLRYEMAEEQQQYPASYFFRVTQDGHVQVKQSLLNDVQLSPKYTLLVAGYNVAEPGSGPLVYITLYVNVRRNQAGPQFNRTVYYSNITDTHPIGGLVIILQGRDPDGGSITYNLVGDENAKAHFFVHPTTGEIILIKSLADVTTSYFYLVIEACDDDRPKKCVNLTSTINVSRNRNLPQFTNVPHTLSNFPPGVNSGYIVYRVQAIYPQGGDLEYQLVGEGPATQYFRINQTTGEIIVRRPLDRDISMYILKVLARVIDQPQLSTTGTVTLFVNTNTKAPQFNPSVIMVPIDPDQQVNTPFRTVTATDEDGDELTYSLIMVIPEYSSQWFRIDPNTGAISLTNSVEYDNSTRYTLVVQAADGGYPSPQFGYATVHVLVDRIGGISVSSFTANISESHPVGGFVKVITATGSGLRGSPRFHITGVYPAPHFFSIVEDTGVIRVHRSLREDSLQLPAFIVRVEVYDSLYPENKASATGVINVMRNPTGPRFTPPTYNVNLTDISPGGMLIQVYATDEDGDDLRYTIESANDDGLNLFHITPDDGVIYMRKPVSEAQKDEYTNMPSSYHITTCFQLILVTYDQAYTDTKNTATVQINVNRNSGNVYFNPSLYPVEVEDTTPIGAALVQVKATDEDGDPITYSILSGGQFFIHPTTGWIYTTGQLSDSDYYLNVQASDRGNPEKTDNATVHIHVVFDTDLPVVTLPPGVDVEVTWPRNRGIINVTATDANLRGELVYELVGDHTSMQFFGINNETGQIYLKRSLLEDPALNTQYFLTVRVYDTAFPENSREALTIFRVNRNPGYPIFIGDYDKTIAEDYGWGVVVNVTAVDAERQKMEYELIGNQRAMQYFYINKDTGAVHIKRPLPAGRNETFYLTVRATDNGKPPNSEETTFTIQVVGTSTGLPVFENTPYIVNVSENRPTDSLVFDQVLARLPSGSQGRVQYELAEYGQFFRIQKDTGFIYLTNSLRDGNLDVYRQRIAAYSSLRPDVKAYTDVVFYVSRNENPPVPEYNYIVVNITDYHQLGARIVTLTATDKDNDHLRYKLTSSRDCLQYFYMDSDTGMMSLRSTLEESSPRTFDCMVTISDRGVGDNPNTAEVNIRVNVIKDVTPEVANVTLEIPEDMAVGTVIATIQGRKDNVVGHLKYESDGIYPAPTFFSINETSGQIQIARSLRKDTLRLTSYTLVVRVFDTSSPSSVGVANVYITVTRNPGQVTVFPTSHRLTIQDTQLVGEDLFILNGTDPSGDKLYWNISSSELAREYFWVNPDTGAISVKKDLTLDTSGTENYVVLVCAYDPYGSTACSNIVVHVNRDKNVPEFPGQQNNFTVPDSTNETTVITIVRARDDDCPDSAQILYNLIGEFPAPSFFEIEPTTGEISLKTDLKLDVSNTNPYVLRVEAYCSAFPENKAVKEFYVYVDRNRYGPEVLNGPFTTDLQEFQPPGYVIFTVMGSDRDGDQLTYRIVGNNDVKHWFYIQPDTGELQLKSPLSDTNITDFNFHINITDRGSPEKFILTPVSIKVIRDTGPPKFNGPYSTAVNETVNIDTFVINVAAEDNDLKGRLIYDINGISPAPQRFVINQNGDIRVKDRLDRDNNEQYRIVVIAYDEKYPSNVGSATVTVTVNRNVYRPEFTRTDYSATVDEHAHVGHLVTNVTATDGDSDGTLYYNIIGNENAPEYFFIHPTSGQILISKVLWKDATQATSYTVVVEAKDRGTPQRSSTAVVLVSVTRNQYAPTFERVANLTIPSHQEVATKIYTIVARDPDPQGPNSVIRYSVVGQHNDTFQIGPDSGVLSLRRSIVRDTRELYIVTVRATDGGRPVPKYRDVNIWIRVVQNTTVPRFTQSEYRANVSELAPLNQFVVQVEVIRNGLALLGELRHDLIGSGAEHFRINRDTGAIYLATNLKQITDVNTFSLTVDAYDTRNAEYGRSSVPVYIRVLRVAEPIRFLYSAFAINITETQERIVPIQRVTATDPKGGQLTYSIDTEASTRTSPQPITHWFYIHPTEGDLSVASYLTGDPEKRTEYKLVIKATDRSIPPRSASTIVNIYVSRNMHAPVFSRSTYTANVSESDRINTEIVTVRATDLDGDAVRYKMAVSNEVTSYFTLDEVSGTISIFRNLQTIPGDLLEFQVIATDRRNPEKTSTATVIVYVSRPSVLPVFSTESYNATISEYVRVQTPVQTVKADGRNSIRYTLQGRGSTTGAARYFIISPNTGVVTVAQSLYTDLTQTKLYQMEITATDTVGAIPYTATAYLDVIVLRNEHGPKFSPDRYLQNVSEEIPYGTNLVTVSATDEDSILQPGYPSSKITYSISSQDQLGNRFFQIHPDSGVVSIRQLLVNDIDRRTQYTFTVIAKDGATVPKSSTALVVINVARQDQPDTGEKVLGFEKNLYYIGTKENVAKNRKLLHLTVRYSLLNAAVQCNIAPRDIGNVFEIRRNFKDCELWQIGDLDREAVDFYNLTITVENVNPENSRKKRAVVYHTYQPATVLVHVFDANDNAPQFVYRQPPYLKSIRDPTESVYYGVISSAALPFSPVVQIWATDADLGPNANVTYGIPPANGAPLPFTISSRDGQIYTTKHFVYTEERNKTTAEPFKLEVFAEDNPTDITETPNRSVNVAWINLILDRHRMIMRIAKQKPVQVAAYKAAIIDILQQKSGYVILIEKIENANLQVQTIRNNVEIRSSDEDTDLWFVAVDPTTKKIVERAQLDIESKIMNKAAVAGIASAVKAGPGVRVDDIRAPYTGETKGPTAAESKFVYMNDGDIWWPYLVIALLILILAIVGIILLCWFWSRYKRYMNRESHLYVPGGTMYGAEFVEPPAYMTHPDEETQSLGMYVVNADDGDEVQGAAVNFHDSDVEDETKSVTMNVGDHIQEDETKSLTMFVPTDEADQGLGEVNLTFQADDLAQAYATGGAHTEAMQVTHTADGGVAAAINPIYEGNQAHTTETREERYVTSYQESRTEL